MCVLECPSGRRDRFCKPVAKARRRFESCLQLCVPKIHFRGEELRVLPVVNSPPRQTEGTAPHHKPRPRRDISDKCYFAAPVISRMLQSRCSAVNSYSQASLRGAWSAQFWAFYGALYRYDAHGLDRAPRDIFGRSTGFRCSLICIPLSKRHTR